MKRYSKAPDTQCLMAQFDLHKMRSCVDECIELFKFNIKINQNKLLIQNVCWLSLICIKCKVAWMNASSYANLISKMDQNELLIQNIC